MVPGVTMPPGELSEAASAGEPWIRQYRSELSAGSYDELLEPSGEPRPSWRRLVALLGSMGQPELRRRWDQARVLLHEHGVSYDAYGDPLGLARPWNLSPIPVVIGAAEWAKISAGIAQRARLLNALLADLYGPQRLLASGDIPPEIVFGHPGFLHACAGVQVPGGHHLPLYSADLARDPEGNVQVLADRTQSPSGAGYALENRIVLGRAMPDVFRECNVVRLALFFRAMRNTLRQLAPQNRDNPRIVLLTAGPYNGTYFEQAFLAQYLGLTLVQGGDLTVRDSHVYLKTLGGLQAVDVILRRVNDDYCDPLELRPDSSLGVAGLVEATRAGNVALANPLGSGLVQTAAFMPFLPDLCRKLLGEELALPSVRTYWCGDKRSLNYVDEHLREMVIKPALPISPKANEPIFGPALSSAAIDDLRARIRDNPQGFVAQEATVLSTVPTLTGDTFSPVHLWMRAYSVVSGDHYEVMPGALSRVGGPGESLGLSLRPGGESKDTWILSGGPVSTFSLLPPESAPAALSRGGGDLPSRVADNLFWLGRYVERAEGTARLVRAMATRISDQQDPNESVLSADLDALLRVFEELTHVPHPNKLAEKAKDKQAKESLVALAERSLLASIASGDPVGVLQANISSAHRAARTIRDRISGDTWRILAQIEQDVRKGQGLTGPNSLAALMSLLNRIVTALAAFNGLAMDSMTSLAFSRYGPAARARRPHRAAAAWRFRSAVPKRRSHPRSAPGSGGQLDDLSPPLPRHLAGSASGRLVADRRDQPTIGAVSSDSARRSRKRAAA
jgi:uncharacterized circularly permuted ATP-grasp superfamily protein